jgi:CheY-like chemotaxis protein
LSIVRRLVELMGGETGVSSEEGVGSTFWFTAHLPISERAARSQPAQRVPVTGKRILVVDDNATNCRILATQRMEHNFLILLADDNAVNQKVAVRLIEKLGYRVDVVADGRAAVDSWRSGRYDLILMDCQMPELDGFEATAEIRRIENGASRIPIVALTAHAMKGVDADCKAAGMDGYLSKPIDRTLLATTLQRFLFDKTVAA